MTYQIDGDRFIVVDQWGQSRTIIGYPICQIAHAIRPEIAHQSKEPQLKTLGRNEPCWCGSGRKYKHCHMPADQNANGIW